MALYRLFDLVVSLLTHCSIGKTILGKVNQLLALAWRIFNVHCLGARFLSSRNDVSFHCPSIVFPEKMIMEFAAEKAISFLGRCTSDLTRDFSWNKEYARVRFITLITYIDPARIARWSTLYPSRNRKSRKRGLSSCQVESMRTLSFSSEIRDFEIPWLCEWMMAAVNDKKFPAICNFNSRESGKFLL